MAGGRRGRQSAAGRRPDALQSSNGDDCLVRAERAESEREAMRKREQQATPGPPSQVPRPQDQADQAGEPGAPTNTINHPPQAHRRGRERERWRGGRAEAEERKREEGEESIRD
jgi:hypothetical protein